MSFSDLERALVEYGWSLNPGVEPAVKRNTNVPKYFKAPPPKLPEAAARVVLQCIREFDYDMDRKLDWLEVLPSCGVGSDRSGLRCKLCTWNVQSTHTNRGLFSFYSNGSEGF